jgi:hypothetical protein
LNRSKIAVFGLLAIAVVSVLNLLLDIPGLKLPDITLFDRHVAQVRPSLPPLGTIGYYTDFIEAPGGTDALREFDLMQYALAPVLIEKNVDQKLVITSLHNGEKPVPYRNLQLVHDFGSGVQLLRNRAK